MFQYHCTTCSKNQLIFSSQITSLVNTEHGIELRFTCWCGAEHTQITGNKARRSAVVVAA